MSYLCFTSSEIVLNAVTLRYQCFLKNCMTSSANLSKQENSSLKNCKINKFLLMAVAQEYFPFNDEGISSLETVLERSSTLPR